MAKDATELQGLRILIVEDNFLVADMISDVLADRGCDVVGPVPSLERGSKSAQESDGVALWVYLQAENRADALWAAWALAEACADFFEEFDLWDGAKHLLRSETMTPQFLSDSAEEVSAASQQSLLDTEEALLRSQVAVARSQRLLAATAALRDRLLQLNGQAETP